MTQNSRLGAGWVLALLMLLVILGGCGSKRTPTPLPTLPNVTERPLTPTQPPLPKYLPTVAQTARAVATPVATPVPTEMVTPVERLEATPTREEAIVEVVVSEAPGFTGPGETFGLAGVARAGDQFIVEERSPDGRWLHVCCFAGRPGWISLQHVRPLTSLDQVPVATVAASTPGMSPLATPTPTP